MKCDANRIQYKALMEEVERALESSNHSAEAVRDIAAALETIADERSCSAAGPGRSPSS